MGKAHHPYGWDSLETIDTRSLEPLSAHRAGDGWWVLSIEGGIHCMTENAAIESTNSELGDFLIGLAADTMASQLRRETVWSDYGSLQNYLN